ncbi:ankyrin repeat domain-containing protein [Haloferula chungangensis]|uniref:Ankyrin repeat domain-containing protein n=1 Tax=Haloferula chungangensis TaxID=1048331 RepID=A0ABW2LD22_9BACT
MPIRPTLYGTSLVALFLFASCKERGEVERESLSVAGYEVTQEAFFRAAESDDVRAMKTMIDAGLALDSMDERGRTALHAAAGSGAIQSIDFMLDREMDVNVRDANGRTPLMEAVMESTPETVRYLLRQGADPSLKDDEKFKPLMLAVRDSRKSMVPELAPYVREDLDDALLAAAILGQAEVIDELTNFGASIYARIDDGRTPLMLAAQNGHPEAVEMLLEIGANRFAMDQKGRTAKDLAEESGHEMVSMRLAEGPQEGDFELSEPVELGMEMAAEVEKHLVDEASELASNETPDQEADQEADPRETAADGESSGEMAAHQNGSTSGVGSADADQGTPWNQPLPGQGEGAVGRLPQAKKAPEFLDGVVLEGDAVSNSERPAAVAENALPEPSPSPIIMRSYRQRELPLIVESADKGVASVRMVGGETQKVSEGTTIPGTTLQVIKVHRKMQSGKENFGNPVEVSVVEIKDSRTGMSRDLVAELPALAHDPVALVEDSSSGRYYVARAGQRFKTADGTDYLVADVRPNQVVIENVQTRATTTIPLRGPRG